MRLQRTIKNAVSFSGVGLHTGRLATVILKPAPRDTGIVFIRTDRKTIIKANVNSVVDTAFATTIGYNGTRIKTVEHLLSAVNGLGIDNLIVEVDGPEIPVLDGSSTELVSIILSAGIARQGKRRPYVRITQPIILEDGNASIMAVPYNGRKISYTLQFKHELFKYQSLTIELDEERFVTDVAPARTFGFLKQVELLRANGLAKGGSMDNAIVIDDNGVLNSTGLRFSDEFVRHKILDLIGDLALLGYPIYGHIIAERAGHSAHIRFLKKLISSPHCWELYSQSNTITEGIFVYA
ncbi:MAG: UDP-3-O-acyl-N-acetylglucosamine deacetylase [Nitrospirae bacterium]|nr:UDP-3-O-acyl-N-acetylglucosamine deacetylase [Nitrospirota bacterium]